MPNRLVLILIAAGLVLVGCNAADPAVIDELAARIQVLQDQQEIQRVLLDYGRFLDARDLRAYANLFAAEGEWVGGFGTAKGPDGIFQFMTDSLGSGGNLSNSYHILSNFEIDVDGGRAKAWSRWAFIMPNANGQPRIAQGGRYEDTLIRENGAWKFLRREAFNDLPAVLTPAQRDEVRKGGKAK